MRYGRHRRSSPRSDPAERSSSSTERATPRSTLPSPHRRLHRRAKAQHAGPKKVVRELSPPPAWKSGAVRLTYTQRRVPWPGGHRALSGYPQRRPRQPQLPDPDRARAACRRGMLAAHTSGARRAASISNTWWRRCTAQTLKRSGLGSGVVEVILPDGEQHKTLATASRVFDVMIANRFGRDGIVLALGGGVIGDLAGFVAACYQRGVDLIQMPTTLLAYVDSSVGGKTAVNHPGGKNMIGAFHQPRAVIADTDLLQTLPDRELRAGLAEVVKYGLICDPAFFDWIEANIDALLARASDGAGLRDPPFLPDQGADRRPRRARTGRARAAEPRPYLRPCRSNPRPATWTGSTARRSAPAC